MGSRWSPRRTPPGGGRPRCRRTRDRRAAAGQKPSDIITRDSLENAIARVASSGGSTNASCICWRRARGRHRAVDRGFDAIARRTPLLCDLTPAVNTSRSTLRAGGVPLVARRLLDAVCCTRRADGHRAQRRRSRREAARRRASASCGRSTTRSSQPAASHPARQPRARGTASSSSRARASPPRGAGARLQRRRRDAPSRQPRSSRATSS